MINLYFLIILDLKLNIMISFKKKFEHPKLAYYYYVQTT